MGDNNPNDYLRQLLEMVNKLDKKIDQIDKKITITSEKYNREDIVKLEELLKKHQYLTTSLISQDEVLSEKS